MMKLKRPLLIVLFAAFTLILNTSAQDDVQPEPQPPLLPMLALVPDTPHSVSDVIMYNDRLAIETAYPGTKKIASWAEFDAIGTGNEDLNEQERWWMASLNSMYYSYLGQYLRVSENSPQVVGFDFFEVDREFSYGAPPGQVLILQGGFDMDAVRTAFGNQGFEQDDAGADAAELWCGPDGCQAGTETNIQDRDPANPFGGHLGRKQPLVIGEDYLLSSAGIEPVQRHLDVLNDEHDSLADLPEYQAAVTAISEERVVIQAAFLDGEALLQVTNVSPTSNSGGPLEPEQQRTLLESVLEDYETLPVPELIVFADTATETGQVGIIALTYDNTDDAERATQIVRGRLETYTSLGIHQPFSDILKGRRVRFIIPMVYEYSSDMYIGLLLLPTLKAEGDDIVAVTAFAVDPADRPDLTPPGLIYRFLADTIFHSDTAWLSTIPREELEAELEVLGG